MAAAQKPKIVKVEVQAWPHNGEGHPELQFKDFVNGEFIGGQVASMRMSMRYRHVVTPWARRQGKSRMYQFLFLNEAKITSGFYYGGLVYPDHTLAAKVAEGFKDSWGPFVKDFKINDKDQDRWIELHPQEMPTGTAPTWFTPRMIEKWQRCQGGDKNTGAKIYFWGGQMPHAQKIQGFVHPYHRIAFDEAQLIDPEVYPIVGPMLRDVRGYENYSGTPWATGIGNPHFEEMWDIAGDPASSGWFRMRVPDGTNPHVPPVSKDELLRMRQDEIDQTMYARFLTNAGAVFSNLDRVFILVPLDPEHPTLDWVRNLRSLYSLPSIEWWIHTSRPLDGHVYGASIDWARSPKGDYSCLSVFDFSTGKQAAVFRWRGENLPQQMEMVLAIQKHYGAQQLHADGNGMGEAMSDFMRRRHALGFVAHRFGSNKEHYVTVAKVLFLDAEVSMIDCAVQRKEFKNFSAHEALGLGSDKKITYAAPSGKHDDMVASFLQLAPTLTISGRQAVHVPDAPPEPMFDEAGDTTMEKWAEGLPTPFDRRDDGDGMTWDSVVLPPNYR